MSANPHLSGKAKTSASSLHLGEKIRPALLAFIGVFATGWVANQFIEGVGMKTLLASMGASAVILFAMPSSPVARPWAFVGGHFLSALVGLFCARWSGQPWAAAALAVGLSIFAMHLADCLHPPGGATALIPVLGGESVRALGWQFLLTPLGLNIAVLLGISLLYRLSLSLNKPRAPAAAGRAARPPTERLGIQSDDLRAALSQMGQFVDASEQELHQIYRLASANAMQRHFGDVYAAQIMTPDPLTVEFGTDLDEAWELMRKHRVKALPVVDRGRHVIGILTQSDFFRYANAEKLDGMGARLRAMLQPTPATHSNKPEVAGQIMSAPVITAHSGQPLADLASVLSEWGVHQLPVVNERNKLVGLITQTDLIAALHRCVSLQAGQAG